MNLKTKIIIGIVVIAALVGTFFLGGEISDKENVAKSSESGFTDTIEKDKPTSKSSADTKIPETVNDEAEPLPTEKPAETKAPEKEEEPSCTLSVRCDTVLNKPDKLLPEKHSVIPGNGVIFPEKSVKFTDGESVFDVLQREMKNSGIHMEFSTTPIYKSAYIEGIGNLYEFDCGELSGWMYKVNGKFPSYSSSRHILKNGDKIEWVYTCDLGKDVGGEYAGGQQNE